MTDLIERQAALSIIRMAMPEETSGSLLYQSVKQIPTIDAVPVVRCKDCINFTNGKDEWGSCFENPMKMWRETDFCSWGERKDDERSD